MSIFNVIAYLLTDGGIGSNGAIYVASNSKAVLEDFKNQVVEAFGDQNFWLNKAGNSTVIRFSNNEVRKELLSYSSSYRTRPCNTHPQCPKWRGRKTRSCNCDPITKLPSTKIPEEIITADKEIKKAFLMRVFTADGGACLSFRKRDDRKGQTEVRRMVVLRCDNITLLKEYSKMLLEFDISHRIDNTQIQIEKLDSIRRFRNEINFLPGVNAERSKRWNKTEKRHLLELMLNPSSLRPTVHL